MCLPMEPVWLSMWAVGRASQAVVLTRATATPLKGFKQKRVIILFVFWKLILLVMLRM